jgi:hypothetical protein
VGVHQAVPNQDAKGEAHLYLSAVEYLRVYAPGILEFLTTDPPTALAADEEWMAEREVALGIPARFSPTGARLYHVALLGWCFAPARE